MYILFLKNIYNKLFYNNTFDIIKIYWNIIIYKIIPILLPISIIGYNNFFINLLRHIITIYLAINLLITDFILRQSVRIRTCDNLIEHNCDRCSQDIIWNIQDIASNVVFYILGGAISKYNMYTDIYWRSYLHAIPIFIKNKLCISKSINFQYIGLIFGLINYFIEFVLSYILPNEYLLLMMFFITFVIDTIIFNLDLKYKDTFNFSSIFLDIIWKISQCLTVGYLEIKKRSYIDKDIIYDIINYFNYFRNNTYYRFILWKEFQTLDNFISFGKTSVFYREHILNIHELLSIANNYLENNMIIKIARKTKILHVSTMLKPFMSSQNKFYIRLFESRKKIEPFIAQIINDLDTSIKNTKSENLYEELYNCQKKVNSDNIEIIENHY